MTAERIVEIRGLQVLDSRGRPTVQASVTLEGGARGIASVPSGASTGRHEAVERRDGDPKRYAGRGVLEAVARISAEIEPALVGARAGVQEEIDRRLIELDGTESKSRLGANAMLAVSLAAARAAANARALPLWRHLRGSQEPSLPMPMVNMISGGAHALDGLDFQDLLAIPLGARSFTEALEMTVALRDALADELAALGLSRLKADEGGFGPALADQESGFAVLLAAVRRAGLAPGQDVGFACDVAASQLYDEHEGVYVLRREGRALDSQAMVEMLAGLLERYPIVSIEDPLDQDDWEGWEYATRVLGPRVQLIGDDLFVTNPGRLEHGVSRNVANAILVKMNQIGTISETLAVIEQARRSGYATVVSARSGETEDAALADLAVATGAGQIKVGSVAQSERLAKYNRLLAIEADMGATARFAGAGCIAGLSERR